MPFVHPTAEDLARFEDMSDGHDDESFLSEEFYAHSEEAACGTPVSRPEATVTFKSVHPKLPMLDLGVTTQPMSSVFYDDSLFEFPMPQPLTLSPTQLSAHLAYFPPSPDRHLRKTRSTTSFHTARTHFSTSSRPTSPAPPLPSLRPPTPPAPIPIRISTSPSLPLTSVPLTPLTPTTPTTPALSPTSTFSRTSFSSLSSFSSATPTRTDPSPDSFLILDDAPLPSASSSTPSLFHRRRPAMATKPTLNLAPRYPPAPSPPPHSLPTPPPPPPPRSHSSQPLGHRESFLPTLSSDDVLLFAAAASSADVGRDVRSGSRLNGTYPHSIAPSSIRTSRETDAHIGGPYTLISPTRSDSPAMSLNGSGGNVRAPSPFKKMVGRFVRPKRST